MFAKMTSKMNRMMRTLTLAVALMVAAVGCETGMEDGMPGDGAGPGGSSPTGSAPNGGLTVEESLNNLGVNTTETPRLDENGNELSEDFGPLGATKAVCPKELFMLVPDAADRHEPASFVELVDGQKQELKSLEPNIDWHMELSGDDVFQDHTAASQSTRVAAAGDLDGDGKDEVVMVYSHHEKIYMEVLGQDTQKGGEAFTHIATDHDVKDLSVTTGFDAKGRANMVVGVSTSDAAYLLFVERDAETGEVSVTDAGTPTFTAQQADSALSMRLATGNIDRDNPSELVVVVNEFKYGEMIPSRYFVFDDAATGHAELAGGEIRSESDQPALVADADLGDLDEDGKDEIMLGGMTELADGANDDIEHVFVVLEDAHAEAAPLQPVLQMSDQRQYCDDDHGFSNLVRTIFVSLFDIDGDDDLEMQANGKVYFLDGEAHADELSIPKGMFWTNENSGGIVGNATATISTGDLTGDGMEEIITYSQHSGEINIWKLGPSQEEPTLDMVKSITENVGNTDKDGSRRRGAFPIIIPCNVDNDGMILKYESHQFFFTEPVIMAVLAAAPCKEGIGQDTDACRTSYGESNGVISEKTNTFSTSTSAFLDGSVEIFSVIEAGAEHEITESTARTTGSAYELTRTVTFSSGGLNDAVVFTSIPLDRYTYRVVGEEEPTFMYINVPRRPRVLLVERDYYNANVPEGSFKIGDDVLQHTPGDLDSYPSFEQARNLSNRGHGIFTKFEEALTVPQGALMEDDLTVEFTNEETQGTAHQVDYTTTFKASVFGLGGGMTIGSSEESAFSWGSTTGNSYSVTLAGIPAEFYAENMYTTGLFTYIHNANQPDKPQFEVISYWVK